jgi:hypothetical protein
LPTLRGHSEARSVHLYNDIEYLTAIEFIEGVLRGAGDV